MCSRFPHLTLQVVRANVAARKRVKYADPFVKQLSHPDVVVSVHACHSSNTLIAAAVDLLPQTDASGRVGLQLFDSPQVETVAAAVDAIKVWKRDSILASYAPKFLPGFPDHIRSAAGALVSDMARHGAIKDTERESAYHFAHAEDGVRVKLEAIEHLQDAGLIQEVFCNDDHSAWLLDKSALAHCNLQLSLHLPRLLNAVGDQSPALTWTRMECISYLHNKGWDMRVLSDKADTLCVADLDLASHGSDDFEKHFYMFKGTLLQRYLCCLCYADAQIPLPARPQRIQHFQTHKYYGQLLGLEDKQRRQRNLPAISAGDAAVPPEVFCVAQATLETRLIMLYSPQCF